MTAEQDKGEKMKAWQLSLRVLMSQHTVINMFTSVAGALDCGSEAALVFALTVLVKHSVKATRVQIHKNIDLSADKGTDKLYLSIDEYFLRSKLQQK